MWNIMKAQNYQTKKDNLTIYILLFGILFPFICLLLDGPAGLDSLTGSLTVAVAGETLPFILAIVTLVLTARICGWDQADKTMNYEVLSGHARSEVFFGRVIVSLLWCGISSMVIIVLPALVCSMMNGWGINVELADVVMRYVLALFPVLRLICEFALLTFLLKNCYVAMLIGWVLFSFSFLGSEIYQELTEHELSVQFAGINILKLLTFSNARPEYIDGQDVFIYESTLSSSFIVGTIGVSILVCLLCLAVGYAVFRRQDIH